MLHFKPKQLGDSILELQHSNFSGVAYVELLPNVLQKKHPTVLVLHNGELTYCGFSLPDPTNFSKALGQQFDLEIMATALQLAQKRIDDQTSIRKYLELFIRLKLFAWDDIERYMRKQVILTLEQIFPYAGKIVLNRSVAVDLTYGEDYHGFTWDQLELEFMQRQQVWASLADVIPAANAIPYQLNHSRQTITDDWAKQHLPQWIDGQRTLYDIAHHINLDPLELAHKYRKLVQMDWITFEQEKYLATLQKPQKTVINQPPTTNESQKVNVNYLEKSTHSPAIPTANAVAENRPTILSVDDSLVVQTMIKRAIGEQYNVLLASNAMDALSLLNKEKIELMLLDVTMPDIDGLELCRTVRSIGRFRDLPIVMLTAKDGMFNKIRGQIVGSTHYLTKPVDRPKLLEVLTKYAPITVMS
ncbi:response regulator [Leptothoe sp. LEGE 181152]|nr:response regulator [Leptothoe sp. LEGE 181152]